MTAGAVLSEEVVEKALKAMRAQNWERLAALPICDLAIFQSGLRRLDHPGPRQAGKQIGKVLEEVIGRMAPEMGEKPDKERPEGRTYIILLDYFIDGHPVKDMVRQTDDEAEVGLDISRARFFELRKEAIAALTDQLRQANLEELNRLRVYSLEGKDWKKYHNPYISHQLGQEELGKDIVDVLIDELLTSKSWVFALTGQAGVGKSKVAYEVGKRCYEERLFTAIVAVWVERHRTLDAILDAIGRELERRDVPEKSLPEKQRVIKAEMQERDTLLILDEIEHFEGDWGQLSNFLEGLPDTTRTILTSRHRVSGADPFLPTRDFRTPYPEIAGVKSLVVQPMSEQAALAFLHQQAEKHELFPIPRVSDLRVLLGLPGIVGRPALMRALLALMEREGWRREDLPQFAETEYEHLLVELMRRTYDLLVERHPNAALILHLLPIFESPPHYDAILAMTGILNIEPPTVGRALNTLYRSFLVERIEVEQVGTTYELPPYARAFIRTIQEEMDKQESGLDLFQGESLAEVQKRTYIALGDYYTRELRKRRVGQQVRFLGPEKETVLALLEWYHEEKSEETRTQLIRLMDAVGRPLGILGYLSDRMKWGRRAALACKREGAHRSADRLWFFAHDIAWTHARTRHVDQAMAIWACCLAKATEALESPESLSEGELEDYKAVKALTLRNRSQMSVLQGVEEEFDHAIESLRQSIELWEAIGEEEWKGHTARVLGMALRMKGDMKEALDALRLAHTVLSNEGHSDGIISALADMSLVLYDLGMVDEAWHHSNQAVIRAEDLTPPAPAHAYALWMQARLAQNQGRSLDEVRALGERAVDIYEASFASYWAAAAKRWLDQLLRDYKSNSELH